MGCNRKAGVQPRVRQHRNAISHVVYAEIVASFEQKAGWITQPVVRDICVPVAQRFFDAFFRQVARENVSA